MHDAKTQLSRIVARTEEGEEFLLCRDGIPIAVLVPYRPYAATPTSDRACADGAHEALSRIIEEVERGNIVVLMPGGTGKDTEVSVVRVAPLSAR